MKFHKSRTFKILLLIAVVKISIFLITFVFQLLFKGDEALISLSDFFLETWYRWDGLHYEFIAENGYLSTGEDYIRIVFYPLYPLLIRIVSFTGMGTRWAGLLVSNLTSVIGLFYFVRLAEMDLDEEKSFMALVLLLLFPTAYFFNAPYTEGPFLLFSILAWLGARQGNWALAGCMAGLSILTRVTGLALLPALGVEFLLQKKERPLSWIKVGWLLLIPIGFGVYLLLNKTVLGDPFAFSAIMADKWKKQLSFPWVGLWHAARSFIFFPLTGYSIMVYLFELIAGLLMIVATVLSFQRLRLSYAIYMAALSTLYLSTSFLQSTPRYLLTAFPFFLLGAHWANKKMLTLFYLIICVQVLTLFSCWFTLSQWAF